MVLKLRQHYFKFFKTTYCFAKDLYQLMEKKQHWQIFNATKGMQIILQDLRLIWQYDADDNRYITFISRSINRINILIQRLQSGNFKKLLTELYNQLLDLLPADVSIQLSLFDFHAAFEFSPSSSFSSLRFFPFIAGLLKSAWVVSYDWWKPSTLFKGYEGKQLIFSGIQFMITGDFNPLNHLFDIAWFEAKKLQQNTTDA